LSGDTINLTKIKTLTTLDISNNEFVSFISPIFSEFLTSFTFDLSNNEDCFPESLCTISKLETQCMYYNYDNGRWENRGNEGGLCCNSDNLDGGIVRKCDCNMSNKYC